MELEVENSELVVKPLEMLMRKIEIHMANRCPDLAVELIREFDLNSIPQQTFDAYRRQNNSGIEVVRRAIERHPKFTDQQIALSLRCPINRVIRVRSMMREEAGS
jgi:hypothetical protein